MLLGLGGVAAGICGTFASAYAKPGMRTHILVAVTVALLLASAVGYVADTKADDAWKQAVLDGQNQLYDAQLHCRESVDGQPPDECQLCKAELAANRSAVPDCALELTRPLSADAEVRMQNWIAFGTSSMVNDDARKARSVRGIRLDARRALLLFGGFRCVTHFDQEGRPSHASNCFSASEYEARKDGFGTDFFCTEKADGALTHCQGRTPFEIVRPRPLPGLLFLSLDRESVSAGAASE